MKKIELSEQHTNALKNLVGQGGTGVEALSALFMTAELELRDVLSIDKKSNMGLQSLARQEAVEMLLAIKDLIFPSETHREKGEGSKISPWR